MPSPPRQRPLLEDIERRILYSADTPAGALAAALPRQDAATEQSQPTAPVQAAVELVVLDERVGDADALLRDIAEQAADGRRIEVVRVGAGQDGVDAITAALAGRDDVAALHIVSHGGAGEVLLGREALDGTALLTRAADIAGWGTHLGDGADILLYGCDVAGDEAGRALVQGLAGLTGADVAASTDRTGAAALGGNWRLEMQTGAIETQLAIGLRMQAQWQGVLATYTVTTTADSGAGSLRQAITNANGNAGTDTINFNIAGTGVHTITLSSALPSITGTVILDASTDNSFAANGSRPAIILDGNNLNTDGLLLAAGSGGSTVRGLVIRNFQGDGVQIDAGSGGNTIAGNYIGRLTPTGSSGGTGNGSTGIYVLSAGNTIGGTSAADRNLVSGNANGILIDGASATGNLIVGNYIGTDSAGTSAVGNTFDGIRIQAGATANTIGGANANQRNVITGNTSDGIQIDGEASDGNVIQGNWIGVAASGTAALGNGADAIFVVNGADNTVIGGPNAGEGNWIAEAGVVGIELDGASSGTLVQGNRIGTDLAGTANWGMQENGLLLEDSTAPINGPTNNQILDNIVAFSGQGGVYTVAIQAYNTTGTGNTLSRNLVYGSAGLGIDLGANGVTANDTGDGDTGANNLQNFPVLTLARTDEANQVTVAGTLNSTANSYFRIEFFASASGNSSGYGLGQIYLGHADVATNASGNGTISATLNGVAVPAGYVVSATATRATSAAYTAFTDTSEFAKNVVAISSTQAVLVVDTAADTVNGDTTSISTLLASKGADGLISLREAITAINNTPAGSLPTKIDFSIAGAGVHTITLGSALPAITRPVLIDGTTDAASVAANGGRPAIVLDGNGLNVDGLALTASADGSTIRGLVVRNFGGAAISIEAGSDGNTIVGNYLGAVTAAGSLGAATNGAYTVFVAGANNTLGGSTAADRNVLGTSGAGGVYGLLISGATATGNQILGNYIGIGADGSTAFSGEQAGISVQDGAATTRIDGNVIAASNDSGVFLSTSGTGTVVHNNLIGTNAAGTTAVSAPHTGIWAGVTGANTALTNNVIAGAGQSGIRLDASAGGVIVQGNRIGTDAAGTANWGPQRNGIQVASSNNLIGGTGGGQGNTVAFSNQAASTYDGIAVASGTGNAILGNSVYGTVVGTSGLGIDLGTSGATANDTGDADAGANNLQNFPVLTSAITDGAGSVTVAGTLNSTASSFYRIELFSAPAGSTNNGEGRTFLGFVNVTTDASGNASFSTVLAATVPVGAFLSATATRSNAGFSSFTDTSEFSARTQAITSVLVVDTAADTLGGDTTSIATLLASKGADGLISLREAITAINNTATGGVPIQIRFAIAGTGVHTITLGSALPSITKPVVIDGSTDDSFATNGNRPAIALSGGGSISTGLTLAAGSDGSTVRGLNLGGFSTMAFSVDSSNNTIAGNYIGALTATGAIGGTGNYNGIGITGNNNTVGGTVAADRNVISGNSNRNITLESLTPTGNRIIGNYIGSVDANGTSGTPGSVAGIVVVAGNGTQIGGTGAGEGNLVTGLTGFGVSVTSGTGHAILGNAIHGSNSLGINLGANGVTANDAGDADTGANNLQNFPVLTLARTSGAGSLEIAGTINSTANSFLRIELFANTSSNASGHGEGQTYLGFVNVATDGSGNATFSTTLSITMAAGAFISATATRATDGTYGAFTDTSEFARNVVAISTVQNTLVVDTAADTLDGDTTSLSTLLASKGTDGFISLREAITAINNTPAGSLPTKVNFAISGTGVHTITLGSELPNIARPVILDASTDDSFAANGNRPAIVLQGNGSGSSWVALDFATGSGGSTVRGFVIKGFDTAIYLRPGSAGNTIAGNYLGPLLADGNYDNAAASETTWGLIVESANNTIGGSTAADRNVVSGLLSAGGGVYIVNPTATGNRVIGNYLGANASGTPLGLGGESVIAAAGASNNQIGGTATGEGNLIAGSGSIGVWITQNGTTGNAVLGNSIHANGGLGIDLGTTGVTANDAGDADANGNNLQNFPVLTLARTNGAGSFEIAGTLNSTANSFFRIELFANTSGDSSGHGEGQTYLGFVNMATNGSGNATFSTTLGATVAAGAFISATATKATNGTYSAFTDTSEFARNVVAISSTTQNTIVVDTAADTSDGDTTSLSTLLANKGADGFVSLREAIIAANNTVNASGGPDRIVFAIAGTGVHTITLASALPTITNAVVIDASTDDSFAANGGKPAIVLDANDTAGSALLLANTAGGSTIRGLVVTNYATAGIYIDTGSDGNTIAGNYLGTLDSNGNATANANAGGFALYVGGSNNVIGGSTAADRNVISQASGTFTFQVSGSGNVVRGNYIGTDATGNVRVSTNTRVFGVTGGSNNVIGGPGANDGNVITGGNMGEGGLTISTSGSGTLVQGNRIGVSASGAQLGGGGISVFVNAATVRLLGNWITSTTHHGIYLEASGAVVQGNLIGTDTAGTAAWGSFRSGITISGSNNLIGGTGAGQGNVVAFGNQNNSTLDGVNVTAGAGNTLLGNRIYATLGAGIGIDLAPNGVTANDAGDADTGANNLQNFPVLTLARTNGAGNFEIAGTLNSTANSFFRIELFSNPANDASGYGEGQTFLGFVNVATDGSGNATFSTTLPATVAAGAFVSATATKATDGTYASFTDTSEFARNVVAVSSTQATLVVDTDADTVNGDTTSISTLLADKGADGFISLREAIAAINNTPAGSLPTLVNFSIAGTGVHTITLGSALPAITKPLAIDATTDDSFAANGSRPAVTLNGTGSGFGLDLEAGSGGSTIRGLIIQGFDTGIYLGTGSNGNTIAGNYIGQLGADGSLGGSTTNTWGVIVRSANNTVGGATAADRNVISGATQANLTLDDAAATGNIVTGNYIGTNAAGSVGASGGAIGVFITVGAGNNRFGGTGAGAANLIAGMSSAGVRITSTAGSGNAVLGNSIHSNGALGIDLGTAGVTANDAGDADTGANNLQNFPVLTQALTNGTSQITVSGTLNSTANSFFRIELFASPLSTGQGQTYLGFVNVATDGAGDATIAVTLNGVAVPVGHVLTATATRSDATFSTFTDTSEFSAALPVTEPNVAPVLTPAAPALTPITEDDTANAGQSVASFLGTSVSDTNVGAVQGVAITSLDSGNGSWQYSLDAGASWLAIGTVNDTSALLLRATDMVRFVPNAQNGTTATLTYRAWDQSSGTAGNKVDASTNGGATAFSTATDTASLDVTDVNDAPTVTTSAGNAAYTEGAPAVAIDVGLAVADVDNASLASATVAIGANYANGQDVLAFVDQNGITGSWDAGTGVLTLSGNATVANYQAALRSITYVNTSENPSTATRTVSFTVHDGTASSTAATRDIAVTAVNDAPTITSNGAGASASVSIAENTTAVTTVTATDVDGPSLAYSIGGGADAALFTIDAGTGVLRLIGAPDFEAPADANGDNVYEVVVQASDGTASDTQAISVTVTDADEFDVGAVTDVNAAANQVAENAANGASVGITANAADPDGTATVSYSLSDDAGGRFAIDATTGVVTVADAGLLDYESAASHGITVLATSSDGSTASASFTIALTDVNEGPVGAVTDANAAVNQVSENAANGALAGITAQATDPDASATVSFSLTNDAGGRFAIDASTGVVTVANGTLLDYEAAASHQITVLATSSDGSTSSANFTVTLTDANEAGVGAVTDANAAANQIAENATNGASVGITASAVDPDGTATVSYSLTDNAGGRFAIDATTGVVTVADASLLDYETATSHGITVLATSSDGSTASASFTVNVTDVNENPVGAVTDADAAANQIAENAANGASVGITASAVDPDGTATVSYSLSDDAGGRFAIDASTGVVTVADASLLDYESATSHGITVLATSSDGSTSSASFTIAILDTSEAGVGPVTDANAAANQVAENAANGTAIGITAQASDPDGSDTVSYSLSDDAGGRFTIDANTGVVTVADASLLDYESATSHGITVLATSSDGSTSSASFTIAILDTNEAGVGPVTDADPAANQVAENAANGTAIGITAQASDPDGSDTVSYSLSDDAGGRFTIDASTGVVTVADASLLDYETATSHGITVLATSSDGSTASASFTITLTDANEAPVGAVTDVNAAANQVAENAANGAAVGITAQATDPDGTATVSYSLSDDAGGRFTIDASTGVVTVADASLLDYESATSHGITVLATSSDGSTSSASFTVTVLDASEASVGPVTDANAAANLVAENAANGTAVGITAQASDPDSGDTVSYSLSDDAGGRFTIDASTGVVMVADASLLDYEAATSHSITVLATSSDGSTASASFTVNVTDVNENPVGAVTDANAAANQVAENATNGASVGITASAVDPDGTATVSYSLSDDAGGRFAIDATTGVVTVADASLLDYESATSHGITVLATSSDGSTSSASFTVTVLDASEASVGPVTDANAAANLVAENAANGTAVGITAQASDPDSGDTVSYSLSDDAGGRFTIDASTGVVTVADGTLLDYEAATSHGITVLATSSDGSTASASFTITLTDANEAPVGAVTDVNAAANQVAENAANGAAVGITAQATDPDGTATVSYSLSDDAGGRFAIDANTGVVTVADASLLDYESATSHGITVLATSSDGSTSSASFTVTVLDASEASVGPVTDANAAANLVAENAANGTAVGLTAQASDPDSGDTVSYSLSDDAGGRFTIDASTGVVTVADGTLLDYEAATSHGITVLATSSDGSTASASFTITLTDANEASVGAVTDVNAAANQVAENATNGASVGITASAVDPDGTATVSYSLSDDAGGRFAIDATTGVVTVANASLLDYESATSHGITVLATSSDGSTSSASFTVGVLDASEASVGPVTDANAAANLVAENAANGTAVGLTAQASDPDSGDTVSYSLSDDAGGRFTIDASTGVVTVADGTLLDYEAATSHGITVLATSSDGSTASASFTINVTDVNEDPVGPVSDVDGATDAVPEDAPAGTPVGITAQATDPDGTATVSYSLTDSAGGRFAINAGTGVVTVASSGVLDYETATSHSITVRATSSDGSTSEQMFTIAVLDANEDGVGPIVDTDPASNSVAENAATGAATGLTVQATDPDAADSVSYALVDDAGGRFAIDATSGVVTVADGSLLDHEAATSHGITVRATSTDGSTRDANFTIAVQDQNEFAIGPVADVDASANAVQEGAANGTPVGITAQAVDADGSATVGYSLVDNAGGRFAIDASTGVVTVANGSLLDYEAATSHGITVRATSSDGSTSEQTFTITLLDASEGLGIPVDANAAPNRVPENAANGTAVGITAQSVDPSGGTVSYSLVNDAGGRFTIDAATGVVTVADGSRLDYEAATSHGITVRATSTTGATADASFTVRLSDVNEFSTGPLSDVNVQPDRVNVPAANGTPVGITAFAQDLDGTATVLYTLSDNAGGRFTINAQSGVVTVADGSQLGDAASHTITVRATSTDGSFSERSFTIAVPNSNANAPAITSPDTASVPENTSGVLRVTASDPDTPAGALLYSIVGGDDAARFTVDAQTGELRFITPPDYEGPTDADGDNVYTLRLRVSDGQLSGEQVLTVRVTPVNDNTPRFVDEPSLVEVPENTQAVTRVQAVDGDLPAEALRYFIAGGADAARFVIDPQTGALSFAVAPDFEAPDDADGNRDYALVIGVSDGANEASLALTVRVRDVADSVPAFPDGVIRVTVPELTTSVTSVTATSPDNQALRYSISGGPDGGLFDIDADTGRLWFRAPPQFAQPLDADGDNVYELLVRASNGTLSSTHTVFVTVLGGLVEPPVKVQPPIVPTPDIVPPVPLPAVTPPTAAGNGGNGGTAGGDANAPGTPGGGSQGATPDAGNGTPGDGSGHLPLGAPDPAFGTRTPGTEAAPGVLLAPATQRPLQAGMVPGQRWNTADVPSIRYGADLPALELPALLRVPDLPPIGSTGQSGPPRVEDLVVAAGAEGERGQELDTRAILDETLVGGVVVGLGAAFWASRGSALLASLLAMSPAWTSMDPLPVLDRRRRPLRDPSAPKELVGREEAHNEDLDTTDDQESARDEQAVAEDKT